MGDIEMIIFEGKTGIVNIDQIARTDDFLKFIVIGRLAIKISGGTVCSVGRKALIDIIKREACIELKKLIKQFEDDLK